MRGKLITIEGPDTAGKSTQAQLLKDYFTSHGQECVELHFPDYDHAYGRLIKEILFNCSVDELDKKQFLALQMVFVADQLAAQSKIEAYLEDGIHVILDRYDLSTIVYAASKLAQTSDVESLIKTASLIKKWQTELLVPDLTVILDIQASTILLRKNVLDQFESNRKFMEKVTTFYAALQLQTVKEWEGIYPELLPHFLNRNTLHVDASSSIEEVQDTILREVMNLCQV